MYGASLSMSLGGLEWHFSDWAVGIGEVVLLLLIILCVPHNLLTEMVSTSSTPVEIQSTWNRRSNMATIRINTKRVANIVDNETAGLRPSSTLGSGSEQDLYNATIGLAHVVDNRKKAGMRRGVASDRVRNAERKTQQYRDAQTAVAEANASPDTTNGACNYVLDYGQKMPEWVARMETVQSFGPFVNQSGGGDVPKGAQVVIRILAPVQRVASMIRPARMEGFARSVRTADQAGAGIVSMVVRSLFSESSISPIASLALHCISWSGLG
jgi:hypothetical protein